MTPLVSQTITVPRMARVTWYKHRASMLGVPAMFLVAAALLVIDSLLQRHWVSSHHLTYCLTYAYANGGTSSRCLTAAYSPLTIFAEFVNYWRTEGVVVAVVALAAVAGLFARLPSASQALQVRWLAQHHLSEWVAYQPHSHLVWLTLARNGILVAIAALAVLASVWWLRKHPAE